MDIKHLKQVVELIAKHDLTEFELDEEGVRLSIKRGGAPVATVAPTYLPPPPDLGVQAGGPPAATPAAAAAPVDDGLISIVSPIVGTVYLSPNPEAKPYTSAGSQVGPDTVVCIVEAMKVMNEIKAEVSGTIREVCIENACSVEYGQILYKVEPN